MQKITIKTDSVTAKCRIFPAKRASEVAPTLVELFPAVTSAVPADQVDETGEHLSPGESIPALDLVLEYPTLQQFTELARIELESIGRILNAQ